MKPLDIQSLLEGMAKFGYPLIYPEIDARQEDVLAGIVKSNELRFWEGFPVVLASLLGSRKEATGLQAILDSIKEPDVRERFIRLCFASLILYDYLHFGNEFRAALAGSIVKNAQDEEQVKIMRERFLKEGYITIENKSLSLKRLVNTFMDYVSNQKLHGRVSQDEKAKLKESFRREYNLLQLFTARQKDIVFKKLAGEALTKTEKEYYSRVIRKKILALADPELHSLARKLL